MRLDQLRASENIWWISSSIADIAWEEEGGSNIKTILLELLHETVFPKQACSSIQERTLHCKYTVTLIDSFFYSRKRVKMQNHKASCKRDMQPARPVAR